MRNVVYFCILFLVLSFGNTAAQETTGTFTIGEMVMDEVGNIYVVGGFNNTVNFGNFTVKSNGEQDIFIAKYNTLGKCLWVTKAGGINYDDGKGICLDAKGNIYVTGTFSGTAILGTTITLNAESKKGKNGKKKKEKSGGTDIFIAKYNPSGDALWAIKAGGISDDVANGICLDSKGEIYITGSFSDMATFDNITLKSTGGQDIFIAKYNSSGKCQWATKSGSITDDEGTRIISDAKDNLYTTGHFTKNIILGNTSLTGSGEADVFLAKCNTTGTIQWATKIGGAKYDYVSALDKDKTGNIYITGVFTDTIALDKIILTGYGISDIFIAKYNSLGQCQWATKAGGTTYDNSSAISVDNSGNTYVTGTFMNEANFDSISVYSKITGGGDNFIAKYNSFGNCEAAIAIGTKDNEIGCFITNRLGKLYFLGATTNNLICGATIPSYNGSTTVFLAKYNTLETCEWVTKAAGIENSHSVIDVEFGNYYAKLLIGKEKNLVPFTDQPISLKDTAGEIVQSTKTDDNGDFSFKYINKKANYNVVLENKNLFQDSDIFLATPYGTNLRKLEKNKDNNLFEYKLLPSDLYTLSFLETQDPPLNIKSLRKFHGADTTLIKYVFYKPDSWDIPSDANVQLNEIIKVLRQFPTFTLEISSHTDSNGDDNYNLKLSDKRAKTVVKYIISKGIAENRVSGKGYGETRIRNRCINKVICTEEEHQYNRRTEFKFIKAKKS